MTNTRRVVGFTVAVLLLAACDYSLAVTMPYCPVSDSAKQAADSIPVLCLFPDTIPDSLR